MNRTGEPDVAELMAQLAANAAEIAVLKAEKEALSARVVKLEEELALARLHPFAPKSEKHIDRLFNEAEQVGDEDDAASEDGEVVDLPDTGFATIDKPEGKKRGRRPLPEDLPRERVEYDLADDQKACPCCRHQMHRMREAVTEQLHIEVKAKVLQNVRLSNRNPLVKVVWPIGIVTVLRTRKAASNSIDRASASLFLQSYPMPGAGLSPRSTQGRRIMGLRRVDLPLFKTQSQRAAAATYGMIQPTSAARTLNAPQIRFDALRL